MAKEYAHFGSLKELAPEAMATIVKEAIEFRDNLLVRCHKKLTEIKSGEYVFGSDNELEIELERFLGKVK